MLAIKINIVLNDPPQSPDLNPIKQILSSIEDKLTRSHLHSKKSLGLSCRRHERRQALKSSGQTLTHYDAVLFKSHLLTSPSVVLSKASKLLPSASEAELVHF